MTDSFDKWLSEIEGFGVRSERLSEDLRDPLDKVVPWLRAAYEVGQESAKAERDAYIEALTPSGDTEADYIGEFEFPIEIYESYNESYSQMVQVPWTTVKQIMAAIKARAESNIRR